ncbi:RNA recognition motif domain-containing protein [Candidatus Omnitrophota bacterium]
MNIFVGNLSFDANESDLNKLFEGFGNVASAMIVTRKEKKVPKSRGFGFVQMPDQQQALAAIAALSGKEFMGRPLDVQAARTKPKAGPEGGKRRKMRPEINIEGQHYLREEKDHKTGGYKDGRRSRSFMMRRAAAGIVEKTGLKRKSKENPMRWRKKRGPPKPWQKSQGKFKPWRKADDESRPWKKTAGGSSPWKKAARDSGPRKKSGGEPKPWRKSDGSIKPWKKPSKDAKPWRKSNGRPQKYRKKRTNYARK